METGTVGAQGFDESKLFLFDRSRFPNPFRTWQYPGGVPAAQITSLSEDDDVFALEAGGEWRAYPARWLGPHHIAADRLGGREVLVTL